MSANIEVSLSARIRDEMYLNWTLQLEHLLL